MKLIIKTILLLFLIFQSNIFSQNKSKIDSLKKESLSTTGEKKLNIYIQLATLAKDSSLDLSFEYSKKALDLASKLNSSSFQAKALLSLSFYEFLRYKMSESSKYLSRAFKIYRTIGDSVGVAKSYIQKGLIYWRRGKFNIALQNYLQALTLSKTEKHFETVAKSLNYIGLVYWKKGDYPQSLKNLIASLKIENEMGNKYEIGVTLNNIGKLYNELKDYKKTIEYSERALTISDSLANKYIRGRALNSLGLSFAGLGKYEKALKYLIDAKNVKQSLNDKIGMGFSFQDIGNIYKEMNNSQKALVYYQKSLSLRKETNDQYGIASLLIPIAVVQLESNNFKSAFLSIKQGKIIANKLGAKDLIKEYYKLLSEYYAKQTSFKRAYEYFHKYSNLKDSLFNNNNSKKIAEMDSKYRVDEFQRVIEKLKHKTKIHELEIQKEKSYRISLIFLSLFLLIFVIMIYSRAHLKKRTYDLIQTKNDELNVANKMLLDSEKSLKQLNETKDKFFSIIAHDLKNPFNSILGFYDLIIKEYDDLTEDEKLKYITAMGNSIHNSYSLLENLLQWSRSQMGAIGIDKRRLDLNTLCTSVINEVLPQAKSKKIRLHKNCSADFYAYADSFMIETVIRNLLTNAIKFTNENGEVKLFAQKIDNLYNAIIVKDNGIGISNEIRKNLFNLAENRSNLGTANETGTGLGLLICKEFVEKNGGKLSVESEVGKGSKFIFTLPSSFKRL